MTVYNDTKNCRYCSETKDISLFTRNKSYKDGYATICLKCAREYSANKRKDINFLINERAKKFNTTVKHIANLYETQKVCQICKSNDKRRMLSIDHCHNTGKVRGMLCDNCNRALGFFKDNINYMKNAIKYLEENR